MIEVILLLHSVANTKNRHKIFGKNFVKAILFALIKLLKCWFDELISSESVFFFFHTVHFDNSHGKKDTSMHVYLK